LKATEGPAPFPEYEVPDRKARAWLRRHRKASKVADELIADYLNEIARNRDKLVERYNRNVDQTVERRNRAADEAHR
jgi:hypothetical protein